MSESELKLAKVQRSFRRSLKTYDENAFVQLEIAQTLIKMLCESFLQHKQVMHFERVFEVGCGTGFLTKALLENFDINHIVLNDLVAECEPIITTLLSGLSIDTAVPDGIHKKIEKMPQLKWEFIASDINACEIPDKQNLICSASTLQWMSDIPSLLESFHTSLSDDGWLALTSFGPNHFSELRELNRQMDNESHALNYISEQEWLMKLATKFSVQDIQTYRITLWFDSFDELLKHLRNTGVNGNARKQWNQGMMQGFAEKYESLFAQKGKLPLSYEPLYIIAKKA